MAVYYKRTNRVGGTANDLDGIPLDGGGVNPALSTGDICFVSGEDTYSDGSQSFAVYMLNLSSGETPDGENIIAPATNPGSARWILQRTVPSLTEINDILEAAESAQADAEAAAASAAASAASFSVLAGNSGIVVSGGRTVSHKAASPADVSDNGYTFIRSLTFDQYGHVVSTPGTATVTLSGLGGASAATQTISGTYTFTSEDGGPIQIPTTTFGQAVNRDYIGTSGRSILRKTTEDALLLGSGSWTQTIIKGYNSTVLENSNYELVFSGSTIYGGAGELSLGMNSFGFRWSSGHFTGSVYSAGSPLTSDARLKEDIKPADPSILDQLRGVSFIHSKDKELQLRSFGLIADEVEEILPQDKFSIVQQPAGEDGDENPIKYLDYSQLIGLLVEARRSDIERIRTLEQRIEGLEAILMKFS